MSNEYGIGGGSSQPVFKPGAFTCGDCSRTEVNGLVIGGVPYRLAVAPASMCNNYGMADLYECVITVHDSLTPERRLQTIEHEVLHVISLDAGITLTDDQVNAIACGHFNMLVSNPCYLRALLEVAEGAKNGHPH